MTDRPTDEYLLTDGRRQALAIASQWRGRVPCSLYRDLIQEGYVGLLQAAARYDPERPERFCSFAWRRIDGAIRDWMRRIDHLGRAQRKAVHAGLAEPVHHVPIAKCTVAAEPPWREIERSEQRGLVERNMDRLCRQERQVVAAIMGGESTEEIAKRMGVSASRVSQLKSSAIRKLRRRFRP